MVIELKIRDFHRLKENENLRDENLPAQTFFQYVQKILVGKHCNSFDMETLTVINNTSLSFHENVYRDMSKIVQPGEEHLNELFKRD